MSMAAGAFPHIGHVNPMARTLFKSNPNRTLFSHKSMVTFATADNSHQSYWASLNTDINTHLKQAVLIRPPLVVFEPMHHLTFAAPQTVAPALCIAACELVGGHRDQAMAAASALRLMHASAFTHENLPLTDRPRPVFGHTYGPNIELLTADGMISFGFELLAHLNDPTQNNSDRILRVIIEISRAVGSQGIVEGRYNELQHGESDGDELFHMAWLNHICRKKESVLHACAAACGAILGGGNEEEIEKLRTYGLYVGMIQGIYNKGERNEKWIVKKVSELRELALKELKDFNEGKVKNISSLLENNFCNV